jgi:glycosyltransferase involved in cell wall biosynthesis
LIAAIVPAHNEEAHIGACLDSLLAAAKCEALKGEPVLVIVALDACTDQTGAIAASRNVLVVEGEARNVGAARAQAARVALECGARWLAFTDADTIVDPQWFSAQLALCADAVCGTVSIRDWGSYGEQVRRRFQDEYRDVDEHRHIHGANLGVCAQAYQRAGGFQSLATSEDVALVDALREDGASIVWSAKPRVFTSARREYRAPGGFGAALQRLECEAAGSIDVARP